MGGVGFTAAASTGAEDEDAELLEDAGFVFASLFAFGFAFRSAPACSRRDRTFAS